MREKCHILYINVKLRERVGMKTGLHIRSINVSIDK